MSYDSDYTEVSDNDSDYTEVSDNDSDYLDFNQNNNVDQDINNDLPNNNTNLINTTDNKLDLLIGIFECNSIAFSPNYEKYKELEFSNNIILPHFVLKKIQDYFGKIEFPLYFELCSNTNDNIFIQICTGFDFIEGIENIYVPNRLMNNLVIEEACNITLTYLNNIRVGEKLKIRPHTSDFLKLDDHKQYLENSFLNNYNILSNGETIEVKIMDNTYFLDILDTYPEKNISICNTDLEVEFEKPLDYVEKKNIKAISSPIVKIPNNSENKKIPGKFVAFSGEGRRLGD